MYSLDEGRGIVCENTKKKKGIVLERRCFADARIFVVCNCNYWPYLFWKRFGAKCYSEQQPFRCDVKYLFTRLRKFEGFDANTWFKQYMATSRMTRRSLGKLTLLHYRESKLSFSPEKLILILVLVQGVSDTINLEGFEIVNLWSKYTLYHRKCYSSCKFEVRECVVLDRHLDNVSFLVNKNSHSLL